MNKVRGWFLTLIGTLAFMAGIPCQAAVDTDVSTLLTDVGTVWTSVKDIVIGVVAFFVLLGFVLLLRKRK